MKVVTNNSNSIIIHYLMLFKIYQNLSKFIQIYQSLIFNAIGLQKFFQIIDEDLEKKKHPNMGVI